MRSRDSVQLTAKRCNSALKGSSVTSSGMPRRWMKNIPDRRFWKEKNKYGAKGKFLTLVTGSLGNCSADLLVVVDFVAAIRTARALELELLVQMSSSIFTADF